MGKEKSIKLPEYAPTDFALHLRLHFGPADFSWPGRALLEAVVPKNTTSITFVTQHDRLLREHVKPLLDQYTSILQTICGNCPVILDSRWDGIDEWYLFEDFAVLARVPTVLCLGSSLCHWAAWGNPGIAYTRSDSLAGGRYPPMDAKWHWIQGEALSLTNNAKPEHMSETDWIMHIIEWIANN